MARKKKKKMCDMQRGITKEDAFKILDNINMWIGNCDSKASIILGMIGIITSVVFSSDIFKPLYSIVCSSFSKVGWQLLNSFILWISMISMLVGVAFFIITITPQIIYCYKGSSKQLIQYESIMFYGTVSNFEYSSYKDKADCATNDEIRDDLYFQITSAAKICKAKFLYIKNGILFFSVGLLLFISSMLVFVIIN